MKTRTLIRSLFKMFPKALAKKHHDYVGQMHKGLKEETQRIVLCLDCTTKVIENAHEVNADLIISHHPFIYGSVNKVLKSDPIRRYQYDLLDQYQIPVYSFHTNFDEGKGGMNDALATALELINIKPLIEEPMARIGELKTPMNIKDFAVFAKNKLNVDYGLLINEGVDTIKKVAILGGGGSGYFMCSKNEGADIYISGDAPHHVRRGMVDHKINYLDLPHEIEKIFMPTMKEILLKLDQNLIIDFVDDQKLPEVI